MRPKWQLSIGRPRKSEDHPYKNLAKYGYKPYMMQKKFIMVLISLTNYWKKILQFSDFKFFFLDFWRFKTPKLTLFQFIWQNFSCKMKAGSDLMKTM
jgi:hypothetical protein